MTLSDRTAHVVRHLHPNDRVFLPYLLEPLTIEQVAERMGAGWTRRQAEVAWQRIGVRMGISGGHDWRAHLSRMALLRIVVGLDPCICEDA